MRIIPLFLCALLAGCGSSPAVTDNAATVANGADQVAIDPLAGLPRPGTYEINFTNEIVGDERPGGPRTSTSTVHFSADDFRGEAWVTFVLTGDQCRDEHLAIEHGEINGGVICDLIQTGLFDQQLDVHGHYTSDGWDLNIDATADNQIWRRNATARRIGE